MLYCVAGVIGAISAGKILDKYKCYKSMIFLIAVALSACILGTFFVLLLDLPHLLGIGFVVLAGFPMFSVTTPTF